MAYLSVVIYQKDLLIKPLTYRKGITALVIPLSSPTQKERCVTMLAIIKSPSLKFGTLLFQKKKIVGFSFFMQDNFV